MASSMNNEMDMGIIISTLLYGEYRIDLVQAIEGRYSYCYCCIEYLYVGICAIMCASIGQNRRTDRISSVCWAHTLTQGSLSSLIQNLFFYSIQFSLPACLISFGGCIAWALRVYGVGVW